MPKYPDEHAEHEGEPGSDEAVPSGHGMHTDCALDDWYVPDEHGLGVDRPTEGTK